MTRAMAPNFPQHLVDRETAQRGDRIIQVVCVVLAIGCLLGAAGLVPSINADRLEHQMVINPDEFGTLPWDIELLSKTGTFKALAIDAAFIRAERLKSENKPFELMQLSDWLCSLAPRYPTVWVYAAWNQAYNISVAQYTAEARWKWVSNGLMLLRDKGIPYNPKAISLYKELAWIYWHKIGDFTDDHHWNYKRELGVEMENVLGAPPPVVTPEEAVDHFRRIVEAPRDLEAVLRDDAEVAGLAAQLASVGLSADDALLEFVARYLRNDIQVAGLVKIDESDARQKELLERTRVLTDPRHVPARDRLLATLRSHVLRKRYHMDVDYMLTLMEKFGPLDWRSPFGLSLYWSAYGDMKTKNQLNLNTSDSMNTVRFIFFSLDNMVKRGRMVLEPDFDKPNASYVQLMPDSRFIKYLQAAYLEYGREQLNDPEFDGFKEYPILPNYRAGHVNFLRFAIQQLWFEGTEAGRREAQEYFAWLRKHDREPNGAPKPQYLIPIDTFVEGDISEGVTSFKMAQALINTFLQRHVEEMALDNLEVAEGQLNLARQGWERYMRDKTFDVEDRRLLPDFERMRREMVGAYLQSTGTATLKKHSLWRNLDLAARQASYDELLPTMTRFCEAHVPALNLARMFPEPPGMEEYRKTAPAVPASQPAVDISPGEKAK